ncbi:MAG TPA: ATP-binding protein, partial [Polyangiaceae bacterium]|nr:ATP-binding protein [Polyangiaceae bacterium]
CSVAVFVVDRQGLLALYVGAPLVFIARGGDIAGRALNDVFREAPQLVDAAQRALVGGSPAGIERVGGRLYAYWYKPMRSAGGEPQGTLGCLCDVTGPHRADQAIGRQIELLTALDVVGWTMDPATLRLTGVVGANAAVALTAGDTLAQHVHPDERDTVLAMIRSVAADGRPRTFVHRLAGAGSSAVWLRTRVEARSTERAAGRELVGVMQDISERVATESALRDSESQLRMVLDQLPAVVFTTDRNLRFTFGVGAELAALGLTAQAVLGGISVQEYLHIDDPEHPTLVAYRSALSGAAVSFETEWLGRAYQTHIEPFRDARGCIIGTLAVSWNVTDRKRAEDALRLLAETSAALSESLDYGETLAKVARTMVPRIADWCIVGVIDGDTLGIVASAHVDADKEALFRELAPASLDTLGDIERVVRTGRPLLIREVTDEMLAPGGVPLPPGERGARVAGVLRDLGLRSMMAIPLFARGQTLGAIVLARAGGDRRYGHADLMLAEDLGRRCAIAIDNARLYRAAQSAIEQRDDFLSVASHELRTPLTSMLLRLELLERTAGATNAQYESFRVGLSAVARQAKRLSDLVDGLLDVSRMRMGRLKLERQRFDLAALVRDVASRLEADAARAGCSLLVAAAAPVLGSWDPLRIEQIVTNLLSNAVKYAGSAPIEVAVESDARMARLVVRDRGVGIAPEDQRRIFERFERGASPRGARGGLGLGLYITRQIVEAHGGSIRVASRPGEGTTFVVELPLSPPAQPA